MAVDTVRVWDAWDREISNSVDPWDTWEKVKQQKGFPGGLIAFLQTSTDHDGCGFELPTVVQAYAWPVLQAGKDLVGVAKTGSGKTLAFLLPGFIKLRKLKKNKEIDTERGPALLVMTPTRELCYQIFSDAEKFGKPVQITAACAYGGAPKRDQEWAIKQGPDCLIATPGRLNDFIQNQVVILDQCRFAVLDEADRMLDMGFEPQIRQIMDCLTTDRQTSMFTATWPRECKKLAERYIREPTQIQIGSDDITTNQNIRQHVEVCDSDKDKQPALKKILGYLKQNGNCLVFCNTKRKCRDLAWELEGDKGLGLSAVELHGDLDQRARDSALSKFRSGEVRVLVATDVAARGLDIRNISIVVNYDAPSNAEDYVHRIGRTGRASDFGDAYTFLSSWGDDRKAANIITIMEKAQQEVPQMLRDLAAGRGGGSGSSWGGGGNDSWKASDDKKEDSWDKKDEWWKKDDWNKSEEKEQNDWKKDEWKKDEADDWKKDEWKKDDWKKNDSKNNNEWKASEEKDKWKHSDWKKDTKEAVSWRDARGDDKPEETPEGSLDGGHSEYAAPQEGSGFLDDKPGSLFDLLGKRPAPGEAAYDELPPEKRPRLGDGSPVDEEAEGDPTSVEALVLAGQGGKLKVGDLKGWLEEHGMPTHGVKATLVERVQEALETWLTITVQPRIGPLLNSEQGFG